MIEERWRKPLVQTLGVKFESNYTYIHPKNEKL